MALTILKEIICLTDVLLLKIWKIRGTEVSLELIHCFKKTDTR